ncbi:MAG: DUF368 domain-containing protein [Bacteroidales bacterium]|nr:DUF368 domain-containing protein [Bacteroidales bacterium]
MKNNIIHFLKGILIGIANVIPGVSGGTIALITGILERLLDVIKHTISIRSVQLLLRGKFKEWAQYVDFTFALWVGLGVIIAIISIARLFEYLFAHYPVYIWAFFFGLVLASVYFVVKTVKQLTILNIFIFLLGTAIAISIALMTPASENRQLWYLFICGIIAAASMILPGISGSFVLVLMGNYELIMIQSINEMNINILFPVILGAAIGMLALSHILSWLFKKYPDQVISILSGFMMGSLLIIWPWKEVVYKISSTGEFILSRSGDKIVEKYHWMLPENMNMQTIIAIVFILIGIIVVGLLEYIAHKKTKTS